MKTDNPLQQTTTTAGPPRFKMRAQRKKMKTETRIAQLEKSVAILVQALEMATDYMARVNPKGKKSVAVIAYREIIANTKGAN